MLKKSESLLYASGGVFVRAQLGLTIEKVALTFQDLNYIVDPGSTDLRGRGLHLEAHHAPIGVAGGQYKACIISIHIGLHPHAAHLEYIVSE